MNIDVTHLHLLLNHFPTIGFIIGLALFVAALVVKSEDIWEASLVVLVGIALLTLPTYVTGNAADAALDEAGGMTELTRNIINTHEGGAFLALILIELTGLMAWLALWRHKRGTARSDSLTWSILGMGVVALGVVARAANIGGEIGHEEIRTGVEPTFVGPLGRTVGDFVRDNPFMWIASETLHFIGLSLLLGTVLLLTLRMLGVLKGMSAHAIDRLMPWGMLGFAINTMTGMLFFAAASGQYTGSAAFYYKIGCVVLAGAFTLYFTVDRRWIVAPDQEASGLAKAMSVGTLVFWVGVLFWGSMLPFIGTAF